MHKRNRIIAVLVLLVALSARIYLAGMSAYVWDEDRYWIPLARSISFEPGHLNLPMRGASHPALPAYLIRAGSAVFGQGPFGYRAASILAGLMTVGVAGWLGWRWLGAKAGLLAAALLAVNEYHLGLSVFASEKIFYLLFLMLSAFAFAEFLRNERPSWLYGAAVFAGLSVLCREITLLAGPVYFLALLAGGKASWLRRREPYIAGLIFIAVISPDLVFNFLQPQVVAHGEEGYREHLQRIGGIGFTRQHLLFYARDVIAWIYRIRGQHLFDPAAEYASTNSVAGLMMVLCAAWAVWRWKHADSVARMFAIFFFFPLTFFLLTKPGIPKEGLDPVVWFWVDITLVPGILLMAYAAGTAGWAGRLAKVGCVLGMAVGLLSVSRGLPPLAPYTVAVSPVMIWPADGQWVSVRASFRACAFCKPTMRVSSIRTHRKGFEASEPTAEEVRSLGDGRTFQVRAILTGEILRDYIFVFELAEPNGRPVIYDTAARVAPGQRDQPFWAELPPK